MDRLRQELTCLMNQKNNIIDDEVVQISQLLDIYILEHQKKCMKKSSIKI
ncbi:MULTISPECIES: Spo0E family sporulation regulatory protein-aspartic acid phosphatase [Paenibacillus]|nr:MULTISPECIES: Spo0E family sporulation regulatory protein-aspartic acid phosphatase [Paenibacillus]